MLRLRFSQPWSAPMCTLYTVSIYSGIQVMMFIAGSLIHLPSQKYVDSGARGGDGQIRGQLTSYLDSF